MKKCFFLFASLLIMASTLLAQTKPEVVVRFSKQEGFLRIVLESADEAFMQKAAVSTSPSRIRAEFPDSVKVSGAQGFPFDVASENKTLIINLREPGDIKFMRLNEPPRLVFDIKSGDKQQPSVLSRVFVLDPGHGGYDAGIIAGNAREKDVTLAFSRDLDAALAKKGKKVFLTRRADQYMSLADRINAGNQKKPEIFISIHTSAGGGVVVYSPAMKDYGRDEVVDYYSLFSRQKRFVKKSKALSECIGKSIKEALQGEVVSSELPLPLLNAVSAPAVLIEIPSPGTVVHDQQFRTKLVNAIISGITVYGQ
jgi:N-acetylmuramoyl-L-alanine amidase